MSKNFSFDYRQKRETTIQWMYAWGNITRLGGTEKRMIEAATRLLGQKILVSSLVRSDEDGAFQQKLEDEVGRVVRQPRWMDYANSLLGFQGSVVWSFGLKQSLLARLIKLTRNVPWMLVMPRNGLDHSWKPWMHWADRVTQRMVDLYITNSNVAHDHLLAHGLNEQRVAVVHSALPDEWYKEQTTEASTKFLMVGNSRPEKNQLAGVRAFLAATLPTTLTVYTDNASDIKTYLAELDVFSRDKVRLVEGHQMKPRDYDGYGILLHTSLSESLPLAIMEAQARGCFVVAADTGDTARLVADDCGLLIDPLSQRDISEKILKAFAIAEKERIQRVVPAQMVSTYVDQLIWLIHRARQRFSEA